MDYTSTHSPTNNAAGGARYKVELLHGKSLNRSAQMMTATMSAVPASAQTKKLTTKSLVRRSDR